MPQVNDQLDIQSQVIGDILVRRRVGIERYGTPLQPGNGRDALLDAYEEALDLCMYLKQALVERAGERMPKGTEVEPDRLDSISRRLRAYPTMHLNHDDAAWLVAQLGQGG